MAGTFQSTLPVWGATNRRAMRDGPEGHFNPRSPCGERPEPEESPLCAEIFQSTLPVWGATLEKYTADRLVGISIHAPRVGSDLSACAFFSAWVPFQSTLPVWGATVPGVPQQGSPGISIHAPRVGSDPTLVENIPTIVSFQSTLPVWGATCINIAYNLIRSNFNPRSPCGERHPAEQVKVLAELFQSTLPVWGATTE